MSIFDYVTYSIDNDLLVEKKDRSTSSKAKVPVYSSIDKALGSSLPTGGLFSTTSAKRIYVVTAKPWGNKTQSNKGRTAKGFSSGKDQSPKNPSFKSLKAASQRAKERAGVSAKTKGGEAHKSHQQAKELAPSEDK